MRRTIVTLAAAFVFLVHEIGTAQAVSLGPAAEYNPLINPADFTSTITNPFFSIPVGKKMVYESQTEEGLERIEVLVPGWTREVMGVQTLVFWDRVWLDGQIVEDTRDYLAQHKGTGDVWYFGEHVDNYENGTIKDHAGAWIAGADGAQPGIWMLANPQAGDEFRNEYYAGQAEDMTKILATDETATAQLGTYTGCIKTFDWSPVFQATANKYYCKQVGGTALEVDLQGPETPAEQRTSVVSVEPAGALNVMLPSNYASEGVVAAASSSSNTNIPKDGKNKDGSDWSATLVWIVIGVLFGFLIQRFARRNT